MPSITTQEIAAHVGGELTGPGDTVITGVDRVEVAKPDQITFIRDSKHTGGWATSRAGAVLLTRGVSLETHGRAVIQVADADVALATVLELLSPPPPRPERGVHPSASVDASATIGRGTSIGANCYIGPRVRLGENCVLHANVTLLDDTTLGNGCELFPGVLVYHRCELGDRVILHGNTVIGADGFGYRASTDPKRPGLVKIPHVGTVKIGNDVEIGANSCVDRAKFAATVIGDNTKIDNLVQIAHNCVIGRSCVIAAQSGMAGSVTVGDGVQMGGNVIIRDHVKIGHGAKLAGGAAVMGDVPDGETWAGYPAQEARSAFREAIAVRKLPELVKLLKKGKGAGSDS